MNSEGSDFSAVSKLHNNFHPAHPQDGWVCTSALAEERDQFISDLWEGLFPRDQVTTVEKEEDVEKDIYCSSRGEGQFISDLWEGVYPRDQVTTVEEKEEDGEKELILHIISEARLSLSSPTYNT